MNEIYGVDILTSQEVMIPLLESPIFFVWFFISILSLVVFLVLLSIFIDFPVRATCFAILTALSFVSAILSMCLSPIIEKPSGIKEYKATISEDASFIEVSDRFDIIDQDGKLYTLRDKSPQ